MREGVRREQTAALLETLRPGTGADYLRLTGSADALDSWRRVFPFLPATSETASLEGYLFPDTYHLPDTDEAAEDLIRLQLSPVWQCWSCRNGKRPGPNRQPHCPSRNW